MKQKKWKSIVSVYCVIYTCITLLNSVLYLATGVYEDPSGNWHELDRAIILLIGVAAFTLCAGLPAAGSCIRLVQRLKRRIGQNRIPGYLD